MKKRDLVALLLVLCLLLPTCLVACGGGGRKTPAPTTEEETTTGPETTFKPETTHTPETTKPETSKPETTTEPETTAEPEPEPDPDITIGHIPTNTDRVVTYFSTMTASGTTATTYMQFIYSGESFESHIRIDSENDQIHQYGQIYSDIVIIKNGNGYDIYAGDPNTEGSSCNFGHLSADNVQGMTIINAIMSGNRLEMLDITPDDFASVSYQREGGIVVYTCREPIDPEFYGENQGLFDDGSSTYTIKVDGDKIVSLESNLSGEAVETGKAEISYETHNITPPDGWENASVKHLEGDMLLLALALWYQIFNSDPNQMQ